MLWVVISPSLAFFYFIALSQCCCCFFFMSKIPSINSQRNSIQQQESKGITCIHVCIDKRIVCFFFRRETEPVKFVFFFLSFIRFCFVLYFFLPCSFSIPLFDAYSLFYFTFVWQWLLFKMCALACVILFSFCNRSNVLLWIYEFFCGTTYIYVQMCVL